MPSTKAKEDTDQADQEKEDKIRKEIAAEKEKVKKMTPEQRKKYEAKKAKADMQAQKKRMTKMVKHWMDERWPKLWKERKKN